MLKTSDVRVTNIDCQSNFQQKFVKKFGNVKNSLDLC